MSRQLSDKPGDTTKKKKGVKLPLIPLSGKQSKKSKEEAANTASPTKVSVGGGEDKDSALGNNSDGKKKFKFADLFKDEGMYHSVNEAPVMKVLKKGSGGLIRTPLQELERYEIE